MARILAIDDDASTRLLVQRMLRAAGHEVEVASEGAEGLAKIRSRKPDAVLCDVNMPGIDGFRVLECVRADAATARLPFLMVSALDDREHVRRGLRLGADDYVSKPIDRAELVASVARALDKQHRLSELMAASALAQRDDLSEMYRSRMSRTDVRPLADDVAAGMTGRLMQQTVLFSDIRGFTAICERLPVAHIAELLTHYMRHACDPIAKEGGCIVKLLGDGMMAVFGHDAPADVRSHAAAALRAGWRIVEAAHEFRAWLDTRFDLTGLPAFSVGVGIHTGKVMVVRMVVGGFGEMTVVGDTVNVAARLEGQSKALGWPLVASMETIQSAGPEFTALETRTLSLPGRDSPILVGRLAEETPGIPRDPPPPLPGAGIGAVLRENAQSTAEAAKRALDQTLQALAEQLKAAPRQRTAEPVVRGYRVLGTLADGGMSTTYLAVQESKSRKAVLKILKARREDDENMWRRFRQECAILSSIEHEHVVRIYDQGFGDQMAYIAMEYLAGGTLRDVMTKGLSERQSMSLLSQAASGLVEIHKRGIVHRDIKPANLMLRKEGVLVLTDFGVAKHMGDATGDTIHGEVVGTPYYLSPEQAEGGTITPATDLYSLGVVFYEMLTGSRPYAGETMAEIISQHLLAPVPTLPPHLCAYRPLIDGMLAKRIADRFADGAAILGEIDRIWTDQALRRASR